MRIHRLRFVLALVIALAAPALATSAQAQATPAQQAEAPASTGAAASAPSSASTGLPAESAPPRTLRAYTHVWVAFTIAWLLLFGYVISVGRRFARLEREVEALRG